MRTFEKLRILVTFVCVCSFFLSSISVAVAQDAEVPQPQVPTDVPSLNKATEEESTEEEVPIDVSSFASSSELNKAASSEKVSPLQTST